MAHYFDTSALVKLILPEAESDALKRWVVAKRASAVSSDLCRTELMRTVRRWAPDRVHAARRLLDDTILVEITPADFDAAGRVNPPELRSLDALHLISAHTLGDDLEGIVTYDDRMAEAARAYGILVHAPVDG
jgi:predicted nucleic acid-binding protein